MGQQPTKGPAPKVYRKQPIPFRTSAWEWLTTGYFDESPEENGITVIDGKISSWVGKIQGIDYAQTNSTFRPVYAKEQEKGFKCPTANFITNDKLGYAHSGSLSWMHDGSGATVAIILTNNQPAGIPTPFSNTSQNLFTAGDGPGFSIALANNTAMRAYITNGSDFVRSVATVERGKAAEDSVLVGVSYSSADGVSLFTDTGVYNNGAETKSPVSSSIDDVSNIGISLVGHISDIIIWDRVITATERAEVIAWAKHRIKE